MAPLKIAIVEDEADILEVLRYNLHREGFSVTTAVDGAAGLDQIRREMPDLVLLDLMLPGMGGIDICRHLKASETTKSIPIIMVSAKGEEGDVVLGLHLGADDYITKPFSPRELVARVRAVLRRAQPHQIEAKIEIGHLVIDADQHRVEVDGKEVKFTATEFRLLFHLASNPGRVFSREQLLDHATSNEAVIFDRNIDVHISTIRRKVGSDRQLIETIRGIGYRFIDYP
jgi:phosphate regulon transcriptional regulator PhoB